MIQISLRFFSLMPFRNVCLERVNLGPQTLVLLPDRHAQGADQSQVKRGRQADGRSRHLVQDHLPENPETRLAAKVQAGQFFS